MYISYYICTCIVEIWITFKKRSRPISKLPSKKKIPACVWMQYDWKCTNNLTILTIQTVWRCIYLLTPSRWCLYHVSWYCFYVCGIYDIVNGWIDLEENRINILAHVDREREGCKRKNACCTQNIFCVAVVTKETYPPPLVKFIRKVYFTLLLGWYSRSWRRCSMPIRCILCCNVLCVYCFDVCHVYLWPRSLRRAGPLVIYSLLI